MYKMRRLRRAREGSARGGEAEVRLGWLAGRGVAGSEVRRALAAVTGSMPPLSHRAAAEAALPPASVAARSRGAPQARLASPLEISLASSGDSATVFVSIPRRLRAAARAGGSPRPPPFFEQFLQAGRAHSPVR